MIRRFSKWLRHMHLGLDEPVNSRRRSPRRFQPQLEALEERVVPAFVVANTMDQDIHGLTIAGSLRAGIEFENTGGDPDREIDFGLNTNQSTIIELTSALPAITISGLSINGFTQPGTPAGTFGIVGVSGASGLVFAPSATGAEVQGLNITVSGDGIDLQSGGNQIHNNQITNSQNGVRIDNSSGNAVFDNLLSGNGGAGVVITGSSASGNHIRSNEIGINAFLGDLAQGNSRGVLIENGAHSNLVGGVLGDGNTLAANDYGVEITGVATTDNTIAGNEIGAATTALTGGVELFSGPTAPVSNIFAGVYITGGAPGNFVGPSPDFPSVPGNLISGNGIDGIPGVLVAEAGAGNVVSSNLIGTNGAGDGAANGFSSLGNSIGVEISGASTGTVVNANIISNNFQDGVELLNNTTGNTIEDNSIGVGSGGTPALGNGLYGVHIFLGAFGNTITGNTISNNGPSASRSGAGVYIVDDGTTTNAISGNTIADNFGDGVAVVGASGNTVTGNTINANSSNGLDIDTSSSTVVTDNHLTFNGFDGLLLNAATATDAEDNLMSGNGINGVEITRGTTTTTLKDNFIGTIPAGTSEVDSTGLHWGNLVQGVLIQVSSNNTVTGNLISGNHQNGVIISDPSGTNSLNQETNNTVEGNNIGTDNSGAAPLANPNGHMSINNGDGVGLFGQGASGNTIEDNTVNYNFSSGVDLSATRGNTVKGNRLQANQGDGILFQAGTSGNTVSANFMSANALNGVELRDAANANTITGNYIGVDVTGKIAQGNGVQGVLIWNGPAQNSVSAINNIISDNVVSANQNGIVLLSTSGNVIQGNFVGTDITAKAPLPNAGDGILLGLAGQPASSNAVAQNIVDFNGANGVHIVASVGNTVTGNFITSNVQDGVRIENGAGNNAVGGTTAGAANTINANGIDGVLVDASSNDPIRENAIFGNAHLGIELSRGGNSGIATPNVILITTANNQTTVKLGDGGPTGQLAIDAFLADASSPPQGFQFLGTATVTTDANGNFSITLPGQANGVVVAVTATDTAGNTSQFSVPLIPQAPTFTSTNATTFAVGAAGSFTVIASGVPTPALTESGNLPGGVSFVDNGNGTATLAGTPNATAGGTYTLIITARNGNNPDATQTFTLTVNQAPTITSANATSFLVGSAGAFAVTTGHDFPTHTTLSESGTLPGGVGFTDNGNGTATLSGTPNATASGIFTFTITAHNGINPDASQTFMLTVNQAPSITSANGATFAVGASGTFAVTTGPDFPTSTTLSATGTLPGGVHFTDNGNGTATLSGTPNTGAGGAYTLTITAHNGINPDATQSFTISVNQPPTITSATAATLSVGAAGSFTVTTGNDFPTHTTISKTGTLPGGVSFTDNGNGTATLSGTPNPGTAGTYTLNLTASNGVAPDATQTLTLTVATNLVINPATLPVATLGNAFSQQLTVTGSSGTATVFTATGALDGLTLSSSGLLSGTPTTVTGSPFSFTVTATDNNHGAGTHAYTLTVDPAIVISPTTLPAATQSVAYSQQLTASGGSGAGYVFTSTGPLDGLTLSNTGLLSGTPTAITGSPFTFTVTATDGLHAVGSQQFSLTVGAKIIVGPTTLPAANLGVSYSQQLTATGGSGTGYTFTATGALDGLTLTGTGLLSGTPTTANGSPFNFTVTVTDSAGAVGSQPLTLVVNPPGFSYDPATMTLTIAGTQAQNNFSFGQATTVDAGGVPHTVYSFTLNGNSASYADTALAKVVVTAQGTANTAILITNDTYVDKQGARQETAESVSLGSKTDAGVGTVQKQDAHGNLHTFLTLSGFSTSYAYVGRNDGTVNLFGTAGVPYNGFVSAGNYSYIGGPGLFHLAQGASSVYGYSAGQPTDFAYHYSANPGSAFVVSGTAFSYMSTTDTVNGVTAPYFNVGVGFTQNTGVAKNPGQDYAYIIDSPANDTFVGGTSYSYLYSTNAAGAFTEFDAAFAFALVFGESFVGGTDSAVNNDTGKNILAGFH